MSFQVEDVSKPCSSHISDKIREYIYFLGMGLTDECEKELREYRRNCLDMSEGLDVIDISPHFLSEEIGTVLPFTLHDLQDKSDFKSCQVREIFLSRILELNPTEVATVDTLPPVLQLFYVAWLYWLKKSDPPVYVRLALLLAMFRFYKRTGKSVKKSKVSHVLFDKVVSSKVEKHLTRMTKPASRVLSHGSTTLEMIHWGALWQSVLSACLGLNALLRRPLLQPSNVHEVYDGKLFSHLSVALKREKSPYELFTAAARLLQMEQREMSTFLGDGNCHIV